MIRQLKKIYNRLKQAIIGMNLQNIPKTAIFFFAALCVAMIYRFSFEIYIVLGVAALVFFIKKPFNFLAAALFILINILSAHFFIAVDSQVYSKYLSVKTPTARLHLDKDFKAETGSLLVGSFKQDKSKSTMFYKPVYTAESHIKVYKIPIISSILEYREGASRRIFFATGGKVHTAQALIFADKTFIPETLRDNYNISGLAHLLAMSGTHVGIIIAIFLSVLFFLPLKLRMLAAIFGVLLIAVFGVFTITVVRAACFSIVFMVCYILDIKINSKMFLLFMVSLFMIYSPLVITDISFLLSFGAVFGIIYLVSSGYGFIKAGLLTGVAATLITAPIAMYVFGMTNHLSVFSTLILSPIIYLHILFSLISLVMPQVGLPPLILIETLSNSAVTFFAQVTYFGFILKTIPLWLLIACVVFTIATLASKYKWLSLAALLVIFYPSPKPPEIIFPALTGSSKGFISFIDNRAEIFYQGSASGFKYTFVPFAAKYGIKTFDYGDIRIFNGENNYIKIKEKGKHFTNICLNEKNSDCRFIYHTRSGSVRKKDLDTTTTHIIYKNKLIDPSIYEFSKTGAIIIKNGEVFINDKNNSE